MCALNVKIDKFAHYSINFYHRQIAHLIAFSVQMAKQCGVSLRRYAKYAYLRLAGCPAFSIWLFFEGCGN